ncbi:hypothetical protein BKA69DRAFT_1121485 [Paraphysoderma sedebokerense]|nr:hypothetical protein BKA69DRAFT_1121485 [Paraphysoderma sedebokerense]
MQKVLTCLALFAVIATVVEAVPMIEETGSTQGSDMDTDTDFEGITSSINQLEIAPLFTSVYKINGATWCRLQNQQGAQSSVEGGEPVPPSSICGTSSFFTTKKGNEFFFGLADAESGLADPLFDKVGFASGLMNACRASVRESPSLTSPKVVLMDGYNRLVSNQPELIGSSSVLIGQFDEHQALLRVANIGRNRIIVFRNGHFVSQLRSQLIQAGRNMLGSVPPTMPHPSKEYLVDPRMAVENDLQLQDGDVVIVSSDALLDNVGLSHELKSLINEQVFELSDMSPRMQQLRSNNFMVIQHMEMLAQSLGERALRRQSPRGLPPKEAFVMAFMISKTMVNPTLGDASSSNNL